jgi:hypothetical protein
LEDDKSALFASNFLFAAELSKAIRRSGVDPRSVGRVMLLLAVAAAM